MISSELQTYYQAIKDRAHLVVADSQKLEPPKIDDWTQIDAVGLGELEVFLKKTQDITSKVGSDYGQEVLGKLNADTRFKTHIAVMQAYVEALTSSPNFTTFLQAAGVSSQFINSLVLIHDYGRYIFNGPLPLPYIDGVSEAMLKRNFPNFPTQYLHSMKWITKEIVLPEQDEDLKDSQKIALMLKALDTLGKIQQNGELMDPNFFFENRGPYETWAQQQEENGRLPFYIMGIRNSFNGRRVITRQDYSQQDKELTLRGVRIIEGILGTGFDELRRQAAVIFENNPDEQNL